MRHNRKQTDRPTGRLTGCCWLHCGDDVDCCCCRFSVQLLLACCTICSWWRLPGCAWKVYSSMCCWLKSLRWKSQGSSGTTLLPMVRGDKSYKLMLRFNNYDYALVYVHSYSS